MCIPKTPAVPQIPDRQAASTPDNGDATIRQSDRSRRRLAMAASIFTGGTLGTPTVAAPGGNATLGA